MKASKYIKVYSIVAILFGIGASLILLRTIFFGVGIALLIDGVLLWISKPGTSQQNWLVVGFFILFLCSIIGGAVFNLGTFR